jgi:sugar/nucleoside kinase (ribokinase family)
MQFLVVGDSLVDVAARPAGRLETGSDTRAQIQLGPGGQGANVAVRLARRGASVRLLTPLGSDASGRLVRDALQREQVEVHVLDSDATGAVVAVIDESGERAMLSHRVAFGSGAVERLRSLVDGVDWIHLSGYVIGDPDAGGPLAEWAAGRDPATRLSIGGGALEDDPERLTTVGQRLRQARADLLTIGRDDAERLLATTAGDGLRGLATTARRLVDEYRLPLAVVTGGAVGAGAATAEPNAGELEIAPFPIETPIDATGAGDAFAATLLAELAAQPWPPVQETVRRALQEASRLGALAATRLGAQALVAEERTPLSA